jgi:hypothetical protein
MLPQPVSRFDLCWCLARATMARIDACQKAGLPTQPTPERGLRTITKWPKGSFNCSDQEEITAVASEKPMHPDPLDTLVKRTILERPSCRKCRRPMRVGRNVSGVVRYCELSFECSIFGFCETLATPVHPLRTDTIGWLASELRPPK